MDRLLNSRSAKEPRLTPRNILGDFENILALFPEGRLVPARTRGPNGVQVPEQAIAHLLCKFRIVEFGVIGLIYGQRFVIMPPVTNSASMPGEKEMLKRKITTTDRQIDALVYELFPSG
jgi:hypothetical protein